MVSQHTPPASLPAKSRTAILEAATSVFQEDGFSGARVDEIARRAGANKAMIYYHFSSKQGLYRAVLLNLFEDVVLEVERLRKSPAPPKEKLHALYTRFAERFEEKKALPQIMLREILAGGESMDEGASRALFVILSFVRETIQEGIRTGAFRRVDPFLLHLTVLAPLLVHFAGASFGARVLARAMPQAALPTSDAMLRHLLEVLDRDLAPLPKSPTNRRPRKRP